MEPVYYMDNIGFPQTQEKSGHWVGVAEHVGDALCFQVLTEKRTIINQSVLCSAQPKDTQNKRLGEILPDTPQELRTPVFPDTADPPNAPIDMNIGNVTDHADNSTIQGGPMPIPMPSLILMLMYLQIQGSPLHDDHVELEIALLG